MQQKTFQYALCVMTLIFSFAIASGVLAQDVTTVVISSSTDGLVVPETISAGWVEITFENSGETPLFAIMGRLDDGATMDDFMGALMGMMEGEAGIIPPATFTGSPTTMPGATQSATYNFASGEYVLLNVGGMEPQIATFVVEGDAASSDMEPEADMTVALVDFAFGLPAELPTGEQTWLIENLGEQWHEMAIIPVPDGTTLEDAMSMMMAMEEEVQDESEAGMPEFAMVWSPMSAGEKAWVDVNLAPGTYLVSCFIEDANSEDHALHLELGMIQIVNVVETVAFEDPFGLYTLEYPAELMDVRPDLAREAFGMPFPSVGITDSATTMEMSVAAEMLEPGAWGIGAFFIPAFMFEEMGVPADASLLDLAMAFAAPEPDNAEGAMIGAVEEITLDDGTPAIQIEGPGETEDNFLVFFEVSDGVYAMVPLLSSVDGRTEEMTEKWWATVNSIEFPGSTEDIMAYIASE